MDLIAQLQQKYSLESCSKIVNWVGSSQSRFDKLFELFAGSDKQLAIRSAAPVGYCVKAHPVLMNKHWNTFASNLRKSNLHDAVKRNSVRLLQFVEIPEKQEGIIMDICFRYLENPDEAVAIKAFSITVLHHLSKRYPEIIPEIKTIIEDQWPHQSAAFRKRAMLFKKKKN